MITPSGVVMARATALTMEWVTWINSILNGPMPMACLGLTLISRGSRSRSYSSRRRSTRASVNAVRIFHIHELENLAGSAQCLLKIIVELSKLANWIIEAEHSRDESDKDARRHLAVLYLVAAEV